MLTTRQDALLISSSFPFLAGAATLLSEEPTIAEDGWDTLTSAYAIRRPRLTPEDLIALFPHGGQLGPENWYDLGLAGPVGPWPIPPAGLRNFFVVGCRPSLLASGVWKAEVSLKGLAGARPYKIKIGAGAGTQTAEWANAPGPSGGPAWVNYAKLEVSVAEPTVSVSYLTTATGYGNLALVGTPLAPPVAGIPAIPDVWTALSKYVYHWPNGWVLTASEQDRLIGCNAALITDSYKYIRPKSPG